MNKAYYISLTFTILSTSLALITLLPFDMGGNTNLFGYESICTFTPISTVILLGLAGTSCKIRAKKLKYNFNKLS